jgi:TRAP-type C4-dicarboxylate transport system permease small subunit
VSTPQPGDIDPVAEAAEPHYLPGLPRWWAPFDRLVVKITGWVLFAVGIVFTVLIVMEVVSRYVFSYSISLADASAQYLLVWFFLLGASVALRERAHVGFELLINMLSGPPYLVLLIVGQLMALGFFVLMLWSGAAIIPSALEEVEGATGVSLSWVMAAFPIGFALLIYTQFAVFVSAMRSRGHMRP